MSYDVRTRNELIQLRQEEVRIQEKKEKLAEKLQRTCSHDIVVECLILPIRFCRCCKLEEEGWKGYKRLAGEHVPRVTYVQYCVYKNEELITTVLPSTNVHS